MPYKRSLKVNINILDNKGDSLTSEEVLQELSVNLSEEVPHIEEGEGVRQNKCRFYRSTLWQSA